MIVVDASVAFKWLKNKGEKYRKEALKILHKHLSDEDRITVPDLLFVEVANALVTKTLTRPATIRKNLEFLYKTDLVVYVCKMADLQEAARLAKRYKTSVYDMLYAVIAKRKKAVLVTADDGFKEKTGFRFVKLVKDLT